MLKTRVMPCLLLRNAGLVKTVRFADPVYVGDPINTVRIYNEKEVDELIFLDIMATPNGKPPQFAMVAEIATECFMPFAYGGGVRTAEDAKQLFSAGAEKVAVNSAAFDRPELVTEIATRFGNQSVIASIDVKKKLLGRYEVFTNGGKRATGQDPVAYAVRMQELGAGEILLTSIDRDGVMKGYDVELIRTVARAVDVPVIACGGAGRIEDFAEAVNAGASAVAAGSMVVYQGPHRAVLTNFPTKAELSRVLDLRHSQSIKAIT